MWYLATLIFGIFIGVAVVFILAAWLGAPGDSFDE